MRQHTQVLRAHAGVFERARRAGRLVEKIARVEIVASLSSEICVSAVRILLARREFAGGVAAA